MIFNYHSNEDEKGSILHPDHLHMDGVAPAAIRCQGVIEFARTCLHKEKDEGRRLTLVREHIAGLRVAGFRLQPSQINSIRARASWGEPADDGETAARLLVQSAAKSLLIDVPLRSFDDFSELLGIVATPGGTLSPSQKSAVEKKLRRFLAAVVHGKNIEGTCFTSGNELLSVEKLRGPVQVGQEYFYSVRDLKGSRWVHSCWDRVSILGKWRGGFLAKCNGQQAEVAIRRDSEMLRPRYRIVARFGQPPAPRYFFAAEEDQHNGSRILSTHATDRVASRGRYVLATGEGKKERRRLVTLEGADDRWLYLGASFDNKRIPRAKWRLYLVDRWVTDASPEVKDAAAASPLPSRWQEPAKREPAAPKAAVIAAASRKGRQQNAAA